MFNYSIDQKKQITDPNGNVIVDLTTSIFKSSATNIKDYSVKKIDSYFEMRPDLVALAEYGTINDTEYILKYSGISNPFTICEDDVLMIPSDTEAYGMMAVNNEESDAQNAQTREAQIRNYYKFVNQDYKSDSTSYDNLKNKEIKSGILKSEVDQTNANYMVPYISEDGRTAVTIRNGRIYFGENSGLNVATAANITSTIQNMINNTATALSESNCMYNGSKLADFVRANYKQNN